MPLYFHLKQLTGCTSCILFPSIHSLWQQARTRRSNGSPLENAACYAADCCNEKLSRFESFLFWGIPFNYILLTRIIACCLSLLKQKIINANLRHDFTQMIFISHILALVLFRVVSGGFDQSGYVDRKFAIQR